MPKGRIVRINLDKNFGFVRPDDGSTEVHFTAKQYGEVVAGQLSDGMELEYEVEVPQKSGKSPHALSWKAAGASVATQTPRRAPPGDEQSLEVSFRTEDPVTQENMVMVRTFITFKRNGRPVTDLPVTLFLSTLKKGTTETERRQVQSPSKRPVTLADGTVMFSVYLASGIEDCDFIAKVGVPEYVHPWSKSKPQTVPTTEPTANSSQESVKTTNPTEPPKVERLGFDRTTGFYKFRITNAPAGAEVRTVSGFEVETRPADSKVGENGKLELQLRVKTERARGPVQFRIGDFESERLYVVHPLPPQSAVTRT